MYSWKSLIGQVYIELGNLEGYNVLKIVSQAERHFYRYVSELEEKGYITIDIFDKCTDLCNDSLTLSEIKGFISGIYFALKLKEEFKEDFEKIEEFINSLED